MIQEVKCLCCLSKAKMLGDDCCPFMFTLGCKVKGYLRVYMYMLCIKLLHNDITSLSVLNVSSTKLTVSNIHVYSDHVRVVYVICIHVYNSTISL